MKNLNKITLILLSGALTSNVVAAEDTDIPSYQTMPSMFSKPYSESSDSSKPKQKLTQNEISKLDSYIKKATEENPSLQSATKTVDKTVTPEPGNTDQAERLETMKRTMFADNTTPDSISSTVKVDKGDSISPYPQFKTPTENETEKVEAVKEVDPMKSRAHEIYKANIDKTIMPSDPVSISIAIGRSNKISFTFKELDIRTSNSTATILQDGGDLYVAPNSPEPIGLLVGEKGVPDTMVNVLLLPIEVPPVMAKIRVQLSSKLERERSLYFANIEEKRLKAEQELKEIEKKLKQGPTEMDYTESDYAKRIANLFKAVALEEIPQGFTLKLPNQIAAEDLYPCDSTKLLMYHKTMMQLESQREVIDIVKITNDLNKVRSVEDEYCISEGVYAAATFKKSHLMPGESTELYILRKNNFKKEQLRLNSRKRPSLRD